MIELATLARPYARAAFEVARSADALPAWHQALRFSAALADDDALHSLLNDPRVADDVRVSLLSPQAGMPERYEAFLHLLMQNDRAPILPAIEKQFAALRAEAEQVIRVEVTTPIEIDEEYRNRLQTALRKRFGRDIELETRVDPEMIGGAVIRSGDTVIDSSLRGRLHDMARQLAA